MKPVFSVVLRFTASLLSMCGTSTVLAAPAFSQILPDSSLGSEASTVSPDAMVEGTPVHLIEGGAARGENLFHSFTDFNVGSGLRVYFANPVGIENILSRVTGESVSNIDGLLGVNGPANLFLLNPNGVIFGPNARLDISGSFVTSTADSFKFTDGSEFAAVPSDSDMLTVSVPLGVQYNDVPQGDIAQGGELTVGTGETLVLFGDTVTSRGVLTAPGGTVQVLGNRVSLVDQAVVDVSGVSGGTALIGGDYQGREAAPAAQQTRVGYGVQILANALGTGGGGTVIVWSEGSTEFAGQILARGGPQGSGGFVETSGRQILTVGDTAEVDTRAVSGQLGTWLLDPEDLVVVATGGTAAIAGGTNTPTTASNINAATVVAGLNGSNVTLQADNSIAVNAAIDASGNANAGNLALDAPTVDLNQTVTLAPASTLSGTATTVNVGAAGSVQNGVDAATAGATVNVAAGTFLEGEQVVLDRNVFLSGAGAGSTILDGNNGHRVVLVESGVTATISELTITGGNADGGGGIQNNGTLAIQDSFITNNSGGISGGGIQNNGILSTNSNSTGTRISNNTAANGAGISGGISDSITRTSITGNVASNLGGGIDRSSDLSVGNSVISNNSANFGGGINTGSTDTVFIFQSGITGNTAVSDGGGISNSGALTVDQVGISDNSAGGSGGGISNNAVAGVSGSGDVSIRLSSIRGNTSVFSGGGIQNDGMLTISVVTIDGNTSGNGAGIFGGISATIISSDITNNEASNLGGGIDRVSDLTITDSDISNNSANFGGAINTGSTDTVSITGSTIAGNTAVNDGGGISNAGALTILDSEINNNSAQGSGGGIDNNAVAAVAGSGDVSVANTIISGNTSVFSGGGIRNDADLTVTGSTISGNTSGNGAGIGGGASATITDSFVIDNEASNLGGGIDRVSDLTIANSTISNNSANFGGAINTGSTDTISITGSIIAGNTAVNDGGGISNNGALTIANSNISNNSTGSDGGGIDNNAVASVAGSGDVSIENSIISGNSADNFGGAISNEGALAISDSTLSDNTSTVFGGGIYNNGELTLSSSTVNDNETGSSGGGLENDSAGTATITASTFANNTSESLGGGIGNDGALIIAASTLSGNEAVAGGGIDIAVGSLSITSSVVSGNTAPSAANLSVRDNTFNSGGNNLFGDSGDAGVDDGVTLDGSDIVPDEALEDILETELADNGGPTQTLALVEGSPAIDAGSGSDPDQRGATVVNDIRDIGAFEFEGEPVVPPVTPPVAPPVTPPVIPPVTPPTAPGLPPVPPGGFMNPEAFDSGDGVEEQEEVAETQTLIVAIDSGSEPVQLQAACSTSGDESAFVISGSGGLPAGPNHLGTADTVEIPWITYGEQETTMGVIASPLATPIALVEAQGLSTDASGQAVLVAASDRATSLPSDLRFAGLCQSAGPGGE